MKSIAQLADELGDIRARLDSLKAQESALRARLLQHKPNAPVTGRRFEVSVKSSRRRVFDRSRLPPEMAEDPRYFKTSTTSTVQVRALTAEEDFDVIDRD